MMSNAPMKSISRIFAPTNNRRLNELIGFLLCVSALLLFLALASYSPLDPSFNSASVLTGSHAARNWIGLVGAVIADLMLQFWGVGAFLIPVFAIGLGMRWFRSRRVMSPIAKSLGGIWLLIFVPALLAVALYLSTAFSFASLQVWAPTRFAFVVALWDRYRDWKEERAKKRMQKELDKRRASRPMVTTQLVPARAALQSDEGRAGRPSDSRPEAGAIVRSTGIERMEHEEEVQA